MGILRIDEQKIKGTAISGSILFLIASTLCILLPDIPKLVAIPVSILTLLSLWLCPWQMTLAFLFSALGDYFGACGNMMAQMGCFAVAHIWFIVFFIGRYIKKVEHDKKLTLKAKGYLAVIIFCTAALVTISFAKIVPEIESGIMKAGVSIYTCLIALMMLSALLQRSSIYAIGSILFVFSDFIIAWNTFVEKIPYSGYLIIIPYFLAQWLLFIRATPLRVAPEKRLLRF